MDRQEEVRVKLQMVRNWLEAGGLKGIVLTSRGVVAATIMFPWQILRVRPSAVTACRSYLLTNNIEAPRLREEEVGDLPFEASLISEWGETVARLCNISEVVSDAGSFGLPLAPRSFADLAIPSSPRTLGLELRELLPPALVPNQETPNWK